MKWLLLLFPLPAIAGGFGVFVDAWVDEDRGESAGIEYAYGDDWKPLVLAGRYENFFGTDSWYAGIGVRKSFWTSGYWDVSAGLSALYFDHEGSGLITYDPPETVGTVVGARQTVSFHYRNERYVTPSPSLRVNYKAVGVSLTAFESPTEETTTALQLSYTF